MKPRFNSLSKFALSLCSILFCTAAFAANPSLTATTTPGQAGGTAVINVHFTPGTAPVYSTQFDLILPTGINFQSLTSSYLGKGVSPTSIGSGDVRIVVFDTSSIPTAITAGTLASITVGIATGLPANNYPFTIGNIYSTGPSGLVPTDSPGGMITVGNPTGGNSYIISGAVLLNGAGLSGVTINGGALGNQVTTAGGVYNFGSRLQGTQYSLTPSLAGYQFSPATVPTTTLNGNVAHNFTATPVTTNTMTLSGRVTLNNVGLANVVVGLTLNGVASGSATTNPNGQFIFSNLPQNASYTIVPSLTNHTFNPGSRAGTLPTSVVNADFSAFAGGTSQGFTTAGTVLYRGAPLSGVRVNGGNLGDRDTGSDGKFSFTNVAANTPYTLTPSKAGYYFSPTRRTGTLTRDVATNFTASNCTGIQCPAVTFTASGRVTYNGQGLPGASVRMGRSVGTSQADGSFTVPGLPRSTYYVRPALTGMVFTPVSRRVPITDQNVTGLDFVGKCFSTFKILMNGKCDYPRYSVSGRVLIAGAPVEGVTIRVGTGKTTTDANGAYTLPSIRAGLYYPSASLGGYQFTTNLERKVLRLTQNTTLDFTAVCRAGYSVQNGKCARTIRPRVSTQTQAAAR